MSQTITASYDKVAQAQNAADDLISTGFPQETVYLDEDLRQVKVIVPVVSAPEAEEILERHRGA